MVPSPPDAEFDPDLARLNSAWPVLPDPIKTAVLALLDAAGATAPTSAPDAPGARVSRAYASDGQNYQDEEEASRDERG